MTREVVAVGSFKKSESPNIDPNRYGSSKKETHQVQPQFMETTIGPYQL